MGKFREYLEEGKKIFKKGMKIQYKGFDKEWVDVKIDQVLRNGNARFYVDNEEIEIEPEDTTSYKIK